MSHPTFPIHEREHLLHCIRLLELEKEQHKLKAKRMALRAAYLEVLLKRTKEAGHV